MGYWPPPGTARFVFGAPRKLEILARFSRFPRRGSAPAAQRAKLEKAAGHYFFKRIEPGAPLSARRAAASSARASRISATDISAVFTTLRPAAEKPRSSVATWRAFPAAFGGQGARDARLARTRAPSSCSAEPRCNPCFEGWGRVEGRPRVDHPMRPDRLVCMWYCSCALPEHFLSTFHHFLSPPPPPPPAPPHGGRRPARESEHAQRTTAVPTASARAHDTHRGVRHSSGAILALLLTAGLCFGPRGHHVALLDFWSRSAVPRPLRGQSAQAAQST